MKHSLFFKPPVHKIDIFLNYLCEGFDGITWQLYIYYILQIVANSKSLHQMPTKERGLPVNNMPVSTHPTSFSPLGFYVIAHCCISWGLPHVVFPDFSPSRWDKLSPITLTDQWWQWTYLLTFSPNHLHHSAPLALQSAAHLRKWILCYFVLRHRLGFPVC